MVDPNHAQHQRLRNDRSQGEGISPGGQHASRSVSAAERTHREGYSRRDGAVINLDRAGTRTTGSTDTGDLAVTIGEYIEQFQGGRIDRDASTRATVTPLDIDRP